MGEHSLLYYLGFLKENSILSHIVDNNNMAVCIAVSNPLSYSGFTTSLWGEVGVLSHSSLNPLPPCLPIIHVSPCPLAWLQPPSSSRLLAPKIHPPNCGQSNHVKSHIWLCCPNPAINHLVVQPCFQTWPKLSSTRDSFPNQPHGSLHPFSDQPHFDFLFLHIPATGNYWLFQVPARTSVLHHPAPWHICAEVVLSQMPSFEPLPHKNSFQKTLYFSSQSPPSMLLSLIY